MKRPWMPLYVADYLADTTHLRAAESGAYLHLIMHYWQHGSLPKDDRKMAAIAKMTPSEWKRACPTLYEFFAPDWTHKRIDGELAKSIDISSKRSASAKQRYNKTNANAEQLDTHSHSQRKEDSPPDGGSKYAFESGMIRLNQKDFDLWKANYFYLELGAELLALSDWAETLGPKRWFHAVQKALANRNREVKAAKEAQQKQPYNWNGIEGVI